LENQEKTPARTRILRRLDTLGAVATELARVYREARRGSIASHDTRALVTALKELRATIESADLEKRLRTIELRLGMRT